MNKQLRFVVLLFLGLIAVIVLAWITAIAPPTLQGIAFILAFSAATVYAMAYSVPLGGGEISLMPLMILVAYLVGGRVVGGWVAGLSVLGSAGVRWWRGKHQPESDEPRGRRLVEVTAANFAMHVFGFLASTSVYNAIGGEIPLRCTTLRCTAQVYVMGTVYLTANYALAALYLRSRSRQDLRDYVRSLPRLLFFEWAPPVLAPMVALVYTHLGLGCFILLLVALLTSSRISHDLAAASDRLRRRVRELDSLQAVGQTLSASLDLETIVSTIYDQVSGLMTVTSFYVALYDPDLDEVSFPFMMNEGKRVQLAPRHARHGLTEYVIRTGKPLLIPQDVAQHVATLGLEHIRREAACWLGVPLVAGDEVLGMMAVLSYDAPNVYNRSHLEILEMIAAQAAIAIQNARLYGRTDEALARRVQELNSVLRTVREGILLLDLEWHVLMVNRALADFVGVAQSEVARHPIDALRPEGEPLSMLLRYPLDTLRADCDRLLRGEVDQIQEEVVLAPGLHVERTLTPVRNVDGAISGWLIVLRDLTEEIALARMREDLTGMLIHDLRSPMSLIMASLDMLREADISADREQMLRLVSIAKGSSERVLGLIDELLDIAQLERGQLPLRMSNVRVESLVQEAVTRYEPVAAASQISLKVELDEGLPPVRVDRSLISRVLANLVDNAVKFTPDGGEVTIWARLAPESAPGMLLVGVQDTGPGVPPEAYNQLFEKFRQVPNIRGRRRGTGLGLPLCKLAIEAHGGRIWVESRVGEGSTFFLTLPLATPESEAPSN